MAETPDTKPIVVAIKALGAVHEIDVLDLRIDELESIEAISGLPYFEALNGMLTGGGKMSAGLGFACIAVRRLRPSEDLDDILNELRKQSMKSISFTLVESDDVEVGPTEPGDTSPQEPSKPSPAKGRAASGSRSSSSSTS